MLSYAYNYCFKKEGKEVQHMNMGYRALAPFAEDTFIRA